MTSKEKGLIELDKKKRLKGKIPIGTKTLPF
jgi:hypothetical protein